MMASRIEGELRVAKVNDSQDSSFWNLLTLDHYVLDKELDDAAVRAFERLHYGQHGRPRPHADVEETNSKTTVDKTIEVKGSRSEEEQAGRIETVESVSKDNNNDDLKEDISTCLTSPVTIPESGENPSLVKVSQQALASSPRKRKQHKRTSINGKTVILLEKEAKPSGAELRENAPLSVLSAEPKPAQLPSTEKPIETAPKRVNFETRQISPQDHVILSDVAQTANGISEDGNVNSEDKDKDNSAAEENTAKAASGVKEAGDAITMSTLPKEAKLQFIWKKNIPTSEKCVRLKIDKIKGLITLNYLPDRDTYVSNEISVPCDSYRCWLLVNGKQHGTEPIEVKHYTFEVDLYTEEDDDVTPAVQSAPPNSRPQQQLSGSRVRTAQSATAAEKRSRSEGAPGRSKEVASASSRAPLAASDQRPLAEDMEDVLEGDEGEIRRSDRLERLLRQQMAAKASAAAAAAAAVTAAADDGGDGDGDGADLFMGGFDGLHKQYSDSYLVLSAGSKQSVGSSEQELSKYLGRNDAQPAGRYDDRRAVLPPGGPIARSRSVDTLNKEPDGSYSVTCRTPDGTPTAAGRPAYTKAAEYDKPTGYSVDFLANDVITSTPSREYRNSSEYGTCSEYHGGARDRDHHGDGYASSVQSISSEEPRREMGYLEQSPGLLYSGGGSHQPAIRTPLVTTRTTLATRPCGSDREDAQRMKELDEAVLSLQRKLADRDHDLQVMTRERCHLSEELQRLRQIYETPTEGRDQNEKRINQLIREKENLATEVWKLKRQLEEMKQNLAKPAPDNDQGSFRPEQNGYQDNHLDNYEPNNPNALQRKLEDLQSQMQDVNEAHESTVNKLRSSERDVNKLREENHSLRMALRSRTGELEEENIRLRDQITRLQEEDGEFLKRELAEVRRELQLLRNKNHQLMQDNIKLTEHLRRVDTRVGYNAQDRMEIQNRTRSPGYEHRKPDPLLDDPRSGYTSTKVTKLDDDEQFFRDRHRLTQELRQMAAPQKWSERDFRNHGGEGPYIRAANRDPYSRAKSAPPTRRRDNEMAPAEMMEERRTRHLMDGVHDGGGRGREAADVDRQQTNQIDARLRERSPERLPQQHRDDLDRRTRPQDPRLLNGYRGSVSQGQHERHLSETSSATIDLTRACPLGESQSQPLELMDDYRSSQVPVSNGSPNAPDPNHLTSDLKPSRKHFEPIDDVLDSLNKPPTTRCHLKVDLVDDVLNGLQPIAKQPGLPEVMGSGQGHRVSNGPSEQHGHSLHNCSSGTQNSTVDDLLDGSIDDPGYSRHRRRDSIDSCSTDVILRAADDEMNQINLEKSPVSCDLRVQSGSLRSVSPKPLLTQRNKGSLGATVSSRSSTCCYATKRPFAPRTPADVNIGDVVKFCRHGGKISKGIVKYIGHLPGKHDTYLGLELEHEMAKHDGVYEGVRYFQSKPNRGVFVAFSKVVMAWGE